MLKLFLVASVLFWGNGTFPPCGPPATAMSLKSLPEIAGQADLLGCRVELDPLVVSWPPELQCQLVMHEVGHLFGHDHTPRGVMASPLWGVPPPLCTRLVRAFEGVKTRPARRDVGRAV